MRRFVLILAVIFSFKCFCYNEYIFSPEGSFNYSSSNFGPYILKGFSFEKGVVYGVEENQKKTLIGTVEKLNEWTRSYTYKVGDTVLSTHHASLYSSGSLFDSLKKFEVYDENNQLIGFIEGEWDNRVAACFFFYKADGELFAKAILDDSYSTFSICSADNQILITGGKTLSLEKEYFMFLRSSNKYYWKIKKDDSRPFNALFLWPFVAFLSEVWWD